MHRIEAAVKGYKEFTARTGRGALRLDDIEDVFVMSRKKDGTISLFDAIGTALEAGFMIGYRCAKREKKRKSNKRTAA